MTFTEDNLSDLFDYRDDQIEKLKADRDRLQEEVERLKTELEALHENAACKYHENFDYWKSRAERAEKQARELAELAKDVGHEQTCQVYGGSSLCSCSFDKLLNTIAAYEAKEGK
jgi:ElaB/YqjD/DUF883 family membrane-anchored ribosome-binding protein